MRQILDQLVMLRLGKCRHILFEGKSCSERRAAFYALIAGMPLSGRMMEEKSDTVCPKPRSCRQDRDVALVDVDGTGRQYRTSDRDLEPFRILRLRAVRGDFGA